MSQHVTGPIARPRPDSLVGPPRRSAVPAAARRRALRSAVAERGFVSVADIAREIGVSEMTIRRDLDALERQGVIERSHGGAVPAQREAATAEPSFAARQHVRTGAKLAIARTALRLIDEREAIGLDVGSTVACLAGQLGGRPGLSIVTNSLRAVAALSASGGPMPELYVLGGQLRPREASLCGPIAQHQLAGHWLDKAFIGAAGLAPEGLFDYSVEETQITMGYIRRAAEVIVLCDASKFGLRCFARVCGLDAITRLVTDAEPPPALREALDRNGVQVIIADALVAEPT